MNTSNFDASLDVAYPFRDNVEQDSEGRKEKIGMSWNFKQEVMTKDIDSYR